MFEESLPRLQAVETIQQYNVLRLSMANPRKIRKELTALERAANGGKAPVVKTSLNQRLQLMAASGVKVELLR